MTIVVRCVLAASLSIVVCSCGGGPNANEFGQGCNAQQGTTCQRYTSPLDVAGQIPFNPDFNSTTGVTTTEILWNFFAAHPKL
jgi:hypothetical protein